jgi:shikimate kinase
VSSKPPHRPIALVGLSGAGKSSVGRALAAQLGWPLLDTDALIVEVAGRDVAQIFAAEGEARFRELESAALRTALESSPAIVATGAGVVLRAENRVLLHERALVAWLDAPTTELIARLRAQDEARPLLQGDDPAVRLEALRAARAALYAEVADIRIATDGRAIERICQEVIALLSEIEH